MSDLEKWLGMRQAKPGPWGNAFRREIGIATIRDVAWILPWDL